jgi:hypothetical protein
VLTEVSASNSKCSRMARDKYGVSAKHSFANSSSSWSTWLVWCGCPIVTNSSSCQRRVFGCAAAAGA